MRFDRRADRSGRWQGVHEARRDRAFVVILHRSDVLVELLEVARTREYHGDVDVRRCAASPSTSDALDAAERALPEWLEMHGSHIAV